MRSVYLIASLVLVLLTACATRIGDLTIASSKNLPHEFETLQEGVEGRDCSNILMLLFIPIPFGSLRPSLDEAMDRAIDQVPNANMLTNVTISQEPVVVPLLLVNFIRNCLVTSGDAGRLR